MYVCIVLMVYWENLLICLHFGILYVYYKIAINLLKGAISSRLERTFNRAWNRCPSLRLKLLAHLCSSATVI